ncbi:MAG: DUF342 domain-containing protein [Syntrophomonadaceae bacterium]|nr:DUF342 domain-containing protein [Syntrophomonadaceae bacterium]
MHNQTGSDENEPADGYVEVHLTRDSMEAYLTVHPPRPGGKPATFENAVRALKEARVVEGILPASISEALSLENWGKPILVARGLPAVDGEDAHLDYHFPLPEERFRPVEMEDGKVDYRNLNLIYNVRRGELLVVRTPSKKGTMGITVTGVPIPPKPGKQVALPRGRNTLVDDTGNRLYAAVDGHVSLVSGKVTVQPVLEIWGNVDYAVGNIDFLGSVLVNGSILSGFTVKAGGDIEVRGVVEAASVEAGGNILIRNGIAGARKAVVTAGGSIFTRFVENATVEAGQDIVVGNGIVQSVVRANRSVKAEQRKGTIVGGIIQAGEEICGRVIGSPFCVQTVLEVGVVPRVREEYKAICAEYQEKKKSFELLGQQLEIHLQLMERAGQFASSRRKAILYNLQEEHEVLRQELQELESRKKTLELNIERSQKGNVKVKDTVHPGTDIVIGRAVYSVHEPIQFALFTLQQGEVKFESLR